MATGIFPGGPLSESLYYAELRGFFDEFTRQLPNSGSQILDFSAVSTVARPALQAAAMRRGIEVEIESIEAGEPAADFVIQNPAATRGLGRLPSDLPAVMVHGAVSVFGLERYGRRELLNWLRQVLHPGGVVSGLSLPLESPMVRECLDYIRVFDDVMLAWWVNSRERDGTESIATVIDQTMSAVQDATHRQPMRDSLRQTISQLTESRHLNSSAAECVWQQWSEHVEVLRGRMTCAMDAGSARQLVREAEAAGFTETCVVPFELRGLLFGWHWSAVRP